MRRNVTLIEVLIAFTLLSFLLSSLFFWYRHLSVEKRKLSEVKWPLLEERYAEQKLFSVMTQANLDPYFYLSEENLDQVEGKSLVFTFNYGPQPEPLLSNNVLGRLFIDKNSHTLCLGIWPHPGTEKDQPSKTFIILDNVKDLFFEFYFPPEQNRMPVNPEKIDLAKPKEGWNLEWKKEFHEIPSGMIIKITRLPTKAFKKERELCFAFELARMKYPIIYSKTFSCS
jgi:hypothetical protein